MNMNNLNLDYLNHKVKELSPDAIIDWALQLSANHIVTTSFGAYSAVLLSTFAKKKPDIKVVWCDTGYNQPETYAHAEYLMAKFNLNVHTYIPKQTKAFIEHHMGFPALDDSFHEEFTEMVKLEPFRRALKELQPDIWFTNIRVRQTAYRNSKDILSYSKDGILKVSPFYYWTDEELDELLAQRKLPKNSTYFDPIKALANRECGIHLQ